MDDIFIMTAALRTSRWPPSIVRFYLLAASNEQRLSRLASGAGSRSNSRYRSRGDRGVQTRSPSFRSPGTARPPRSVPGSNGAARDFRERQPPLQPGNGSTVLSFASLRHELISCSIAPESGSSAVTFERDPAPETRRTDDVGILTGSGLLGEQSRRHSSPTIATDREESGPTSSDGIVATFPPSIARIIPTVRALHFEGAWYRKLPTSTNTVSSEDPPLSTSLGSEVKRS